MTQRKKTAKPWGNRVSGSAGERNRRSPLVRANGARGPATRSEAESLVRRQDLWRVHHGAATRVSTGSSRRSGLAELFCGDAVRLDLEVQGLVAHAEQSSRLALVPPRGLQGRTDRPSLGIHRSRLGELLERRAGRPWLARASGRESGVDGEDGEVLRLNHF